MKKLTIAGMIICLISVASAASAQRSSLDAPILDQTNVRVNEAIFAQQKNGVLSDSQAAWLQVRRQSIMAEAVDRRKKNKGILPTGDVSRLIRRMEVLEKQVSRTQ